MQSPRPLTQDIAEDILDGIDDGVIVTDTDGRIVVWNRAAEELTGIAASDASGRTVRAVLSENAAIVIQAEKTVATGRSYSDYEAELLARNRPPLPVGLVSSPLLDGEGNSAGMILTIRDQSGVRDLKERMRRSDRLAALGQIAAGIAHEIKNPLVGIRGAAQLLRSELRSGSGAGDRRSMEEYLDVVLKEADRLNGVLEGILDFTRVKPREVRRHNVHSLLDRVLLLNEETARGSGIMLSRLYDPSLPEIVGEEGQLVQVFLNIVKNAIEAMPAGGKLTIVTRMSDQFTSVQADGRKHRLMVVKVSDTGKGIRREDLPNIFAPFFTTKDRGVGLGLALSYQIVQENLETMRVESREGEGTTFSVYLPLAE